MIKVSSIISCCKVIGLIGLGFVVFGCVSVVFEVFYGIQVVDVSGLCGCFSWVQVLVVLLRVLKVLDMIYIVVVDEGLVYIYFLKMVWVDILLNVVQLKFMEMLQNIGCLCGVGLFGDGLLIDYQLQIEIWVFEFWLDGNNWGVVEIVVCVVNDCNGWMVVSWVFVGQCFSGGILVDQVVVVLNGVVDQVFVEIVGWMFQNV